MCISHNKKEASNAIVLKLNTPERSVNVNFYLRKFLPKQKIIQGQQYHISYQMRSYSNVKVMRGLSCEGSVMHV